MSRINLLQILKEISPSLFDKATSISADRETYKRTDTLGKLYFNKFIGKPLLGGTITDIKTSKTRGAEGVGRGFFVIKIEVTHSEDGENKRNAVFYNIDTDIFDLPSEDPIERKDAVTLSKIAQHVNPDTQYKEIGKNFRIKGWY